MSAYLKIEGLEELIKQVESCASDSEINKVNKKVLNKSGELIKRKLKSRTRRSKNVMHSGIKGFKTYEHAADNIEIQGGKTWITVGWDTSRGKPFSYMQWEEWGNTTRGPHPILYPTLEECRKEVTEEFKRQYEELVKSKLGD